MFERIETLNIDGIDFHGLSTGHTACAFHISISDLELVDHEQVEDAFSQLLKNLNPSIRMRVWLKSQVQFDAAKASSRGEHISTLGYVENDLYLLFELREFKSLTLVKKILRTGSTEGLLRKEATALRSLIDLNVLENVGMRTRSLSSTEFEELLVTCISEVPQRLKYGVDTGKSVWGIIRLNKQSVTGISIVSLAQAKDLLPLPYEYRISIEKLSTEKSESYLRRKTGQTKQGADKISAQKFFDAQDQLEDVTLFGGSLLSIEVFILIERQSEKDLRSDADQIIQRLRAMGEWSLESFGAGQSFLAAQVGFSQHVGLLESNRVTPSYLPVWTYGTSRSFPDPKSKRSLTLHRRDQSLTEIDLFSPDYDNYSAVIFGKSGRGKSVLTNLLTRALHSDPDVRIIKVDVGGSHSKETELLQGQEQTLTLSEPSGINPFSVLANTEHSEDACNVLVGFLNVLLLEEGETFLSKSMRGEIERCVFDYSVSRPRKPTIQDFFDFAKALPRRDLLSRWTYNGIFKNAFRARESSQGSPRAKSPRLQYFNFSQIFQANDPDFGQGGLAAVMAQFNLDLMAAKGKKLVFIADETPFFIERCFSFFKFSTANVRKFGGSFITIAQKSSDVIVGGDTGIIENSAQRFLFSIDGDREAFAKRLKLNDSDLGRIEDLKSHKGFYSEALFQDHLGSRIVSIQLTPSEYWNVTSSSSDNERLNHLLREVDGLTLNQAISALSKVPR